MLHLARLPMSFGFALIGGVVLGGLGVWSIVRTDPAIPAAPITPIAPIAMTDELHPDEVVTVTEAASDDLLPRESLALPADFAFVISLSGTSYLQLSTDDVELAAVIAGRARLVVDQDSAVTAAIAPVRPGALPEPLRAWAGRKVIVDGACAATVVGFATIARVTGSPEYAGIDEDRWTVASVTTSGARMIAARLDGCAAGSWARDAARPAVATGLPVDGATTTRLVAAARADLFTGDAAAATDASWNDPQWGELGDRAKAQWRVEAKLASTVVEHSITHQRWVVLHATVAGGCGTREVNLLGIYRANPDDTVTPVHAAESAAMSIDELVDVDGDGQFELIVTEGLGSDIALRDASDTVLATVSVPFHGCGC